MSRFSLSLSVSSDNHCRIERKKKATQKKFFFLMYFYVFVVVESIHISTYIQTCLAWSRNGTEGEGDDEKKEELVGFHAFAIGLLVAGGRTFASLGRSEGDLIIIIIVVVVKGQAFVFILDE